MAPKVIQDFTPGPWAQWKHLPRYERAIRFIETQCRAPKGYNTGELIKLADFQKEWLRATLVDGISASVESIPRGNGKSTFKSALGLWNVFDYDDTGDPQVPVIATTVKQAMKTIYDPAIRMIELNPELQKRCKVLTSITDPKIVTHINGRMFPISDDPDGLQGLDPSLGMVDEIGFLSIESWASLLLATGKRPNSLVIAIGTPGFDTSSALADVRTRHMEGKLPAEIRFQEYAADEGCRVDDEEQWRKSNPAYVAGFKGRQAFEVALSLPEPLFRIFQLGQWVAGVECWLGVDGKAIWENLTDPYEYALGGPVWAGVDMSRSRDCSAVVTLQERPDGRMHAKARIWYPDKRTGVVNGTEVMNYIRELDRLYKVQGVAYDPRFFDERAGMLEAEKIRMIEFPQSIQRMTPACGDTYEMLKSDVRLLSHDGDPEFQRHILNAVAQYNSERGFTLKKKTPESPDKIDACVALCMAIKTSQEPAPKPKSRLVVL